MPEQRVAKTNINDLRRMMEQYKDQIAMALPKHITPERMIRVALTAFSRTPLLSQCSSTSICGALVQASILGLEPDGLSGEAYLIPYWSTKAGGYECQMQAGYRGIVKLARNTGEYVKIAADAIHDTDIFDYDDGSDTKWTHKRDLRKSVKERGPAYAYYGGYALNTGEKNLVIMHKGDIEAHRDQYSQGAYKKERGKFVLDKEGNKVLVGPWADSSHWMYCKTPLIQVLKLAPKSYQLVTAITLTERGEAGLGQQFVDLPKELSAMPVEEEDPDLNDAREPPISEPQAKATANTTQPAVLITDLQAQRLEKLAEENGWRSKDLLAWLKSKYLIASVHDVRSVDFDHICELIRAGGTEPPK